jgi:adenine deaminase
MFCSDDKHPDTLAEGHINQLVLRALAEGNSLWHVLRAACLNPVLHYQLPVGLLREGDPADYIVVADLQTFRVQQTIIDGRIVAESGDSMIPDLRSEPVNQFNCSVKTAGEFGVEASSGTTTIRIIEALEGQLITNELQAEATIDQNQIVPDIDRDILKLVVVNRYQDVPPAVAFIKNFGLKHGAIASSVGHDSHNITAVGCDDESICRAVNLVIEAKGGLSAVAGERSTDDEMMSRRAFLHLTTRAESQLLPLPVAGLMTDADGYEVAAQYTALDQFAKQELGSTLNAPFMTLSFMALLVIPKLKLSDKGLFDGERFVYTPLQIVK